MENNIKIFRIHQTLSWIYGVMFSVSAFYVTTMQKDGRGLEVLLVPLFLVGLLLLHHFVAKGAKENKGWAKVTSLIIGIIMLIGFPVGTIIGIYLLINNVRWVTGFKQYTDGSFQQIP